MKKNPHPSEKEIVSLVKLGMNVDERIIHNYTPLMFAVKYDYDGLAKFLIERGASTAIKTYIRGETLLIKSISEKSLKVGKYLINKANADIFATDSRGYIPFY